MTVIGRVASSVLCLLLAAGCVADHAPLAPALPSATGRVPVPTAMSTPAVTPTIAADAGCPASWHEPMMRAWGRMEDLSAPRTVVPNRRETIDAAIALVEGMPNWPRGEQARMSLRIALASLDASEAAFEAGDEGAEAGGWGVSRAAVEVAYAAWRALGESPEAPCYVDDGGSAAGG